MSSLWRAWPPFQKRVVAEHRDNDRLGHTAATDYEDIIGGKVIENRRVRDAPENDVLLRPRLREVQYFRG